MKAVSARSMAPKPWTPSLLDRSVGFFVGLLLAAIVGGGAYGWVSNIVKLAGSSFDPLGGVVVVRAIGIPIVPLGIVMGYVP